MTIIFKLFIAFLYYYAKIQFGAVTSTILEFTEKVVEQRNGFFESNETFIRKWFNIRRFCSPHYRNIYLLKSVQYHSGDFVGVDKDETSSKNAVLTVMKFLLEISITE